MMDLVGYLSRPAMTCVLEKPTAMIPTTTLVAKEEPSCSWKSGVLSRLSSLRSSWNQSSQGGIGGLKPRGIIVPSSTSNSNLDGIGGLKPIGIIVPSSTSNSNLDGQQHTLMTGRTELQSQSSQQGTGGQKPIGIIVPSSTIYSNLDGQQPTSMTGRAKLQSQCSQGGTGGQKPISIIVPSSTVNSNLDGQQCTSMTGRTEVQSQSFQWGAGGQKCIGTIVPSSTNNSNLDGQQHTLMIGRIEGVDLAMRKPEEAARNEFSQGSNVDQARVKPEQVVGVLHKKDVHTIKTLMMRKLERESNKKIKDMDDLCREISKGKMWTI